MTLAGLLGKVWVANFIYTHCVDTCPLQTAELANIQKEFAGEGDCRLVSITVDPERDTPEVLNDYAKRYGADPEKWLFLTGEKRAIYRLAQEGFKLSVVDPREGVRKPSGTPPPRGDRSSALGSPFERLAEFFAPPAALAHHPGPFEPFIHSSRFVLVDRRARVRGLYGGVAVLPGGPEGRYVPVYDDAALEQLRRDLRRLLKEK